MLVQRRNKQELFISQSCFVFFFYSEFWPRRFGGKHLAITNHGITCFAQVVTLNIVQLNAIPAEIWDTWNYKESWSLFLVNLRAPNVLNHPEDLGTKLSVKENSRSSLFFPCFSLISFRRSQSIPSFCTWIMKVLQILWDFLKQLSDEISLQPLQHQMFVPEVKELHSSNKETNLGEHDSVSFDSGRVKPNISYPLPMQKPVFVLWNFTFLVFCHVAGESLQWIPTRLRAPGGERKNSVLHT